MSAGMRSAIDKGNITRTEWPGIGRDVMSHLYLGSGRMGCSLDRFGLMHTPFNRNGVWKTVNTALHHADHWTRGAYGIDCFLPIGRLAWADAPPPPAFYRQEHMLYDGYARTVMEWDGCGVEMRAYFHPSHRDWFAVEIDYYQAGRELPDLAYILEREYAASYDQQVRAEWEIETERCSRERWSCRLQAGTADTRVMLKLLVDEGEARLTTSAEGASLKMPGEKGTLLLLIGISAYGRGEELEEELAAIRHREAYRLEAVEAWHERFGDSYMEVSDPTVQALWSRSLSYILSTYAPDVRSPASPTGWTGNGWGFHFPQDISYLHPVLLKLGHLDIARSIVEFYAAHIDDAMDSTSRLFGAEGTMWAWEFPIGRQARQLEDGFPNWCHFEIHNAAYPAKMAYETAKHVRDEDWTRETAWPIIRESARFYASVAVREPNGRWSIESKPSFGQDEFGGPNRKNYLCSLFSAEYTLRIAVEMSAQLQWDPQESGQWSSILKDGWAYDRLTDEVRGILKPVETDDWEAEFGKQKHPVQLNPLAFLPLAASPDKETVRAYHMRSDICGSMNRNHSSGWTLAAFWVASAHIGDAAGLRDGIGRIRGTEYADRDYIQFYESGSFYTMAFYVTTHGLFMQAVLDAAVSDYWGELGIGSAYPADWGPAVFHSLRTMSGEKVSGNRQQGCWSWRAEHSG